MAAVIEAGLVPLSDAARAAGPDWRETILTGGDDYELLFAIPPERAGALHAAAGAGGVLVTRIGHFVSGAPAAHVVDGTGAWVTPSRGGWSHF